MEKKYLVGIDIGASSVRTGIIDFKGKEVSSHQIETKVIYGAKGSVTYDGDEFVHSIHETTRMAIEKAGINSDEIAGVSFGGLRGTIVAYDKDGNIAHPFVSYIDTTFIGLLGEFKKVKEELGISESDFYGELGFTSGAAPLNMAGIIKEKPDVYDKIYKYGNMTLMVGRAYGMQDYLMDSDNANLHGFYNVYEHKNVEKVKKVWEHFGLKEEKVATPVRPGTLVGHVTRDVAEKTGLSEGTPVYMGTGDQQCNDLGAGLVKSGMFSFCLGTMAMIAFRTDKPLRDPNNIVAMNGSPLDAWIGQGVVQAGAVVHKWLRDQLFAKELEEENNSGVNAYTVMDKEALESKPGAHGLLFFPWVNGSKINGDVNRKGGFMGLEYSHTRGDMVRAFYEGVSYELSLNVEVLKENSGAEANVIRVTGGCARSELWMQTIADFCNCPLELLEGNEFGTIGAAMLAGYGSGIFSSLEEAAENMVHVKKRIEPNPENVQFYNELKSIYKGIYKTTCSDAYNQLNTYKRKYF